MADIAYNTASFPALISTMKSLVSLNTSDSHPLILLGYKKRDPSERELWDMIQNEIDIRLSQIGTEVGMGGEAVEIWLSSPK
jgi:protein N-lysine methyltransferase METTL21D